MVLRFREMRLNCRIQVREVAAIVNISPQRLSQIESKLYGSVPQDPERLIKALEQVLASRRREIERAEYICRHERETIFNYIESGGL